MIKRQSKQKQLTEFDIFRYMSSRQITDLGKNFVEVRFRKRDAVVRYDARPDGLYLVKSGRLVANQYSFGGIEVGFKIIGSGSYVGELGAVDGKLRSANIICLDDAVLTHISQNVFAEMLRDVPEFSRALLEDTVSMVRPLSDRLIERTTSSARSRLVSLLVRSAAEAGVVEDQAELENIGTHAQIAALVGTQREVITRELAKLEESKMIAIDRGKISLLEYGQLEALSSGNA